jgi:hypothetical protein
VLETRLPVVTSDSMYGRRAVSETSRIDACGASTALSDLCHQVCWAVRRVRSIGAVVVGVAEHERSSRPAT